MTSRGISADTAARFKLGYDPADGRLTIPYLTPNGPWHVKRRCIADHDCKELNHGKYVYDAGASVEQRLFNPATLLDHDNVVIVEGELDAVACEQAGIPAVAYPGASTWSKTKHWRWCFDSAAEIVVIADGDEPGVKAAAEVAKSLRLSVQADVRVVEMPPGHDASSYLLEFGTTDLLYAIEWI